MGREEVRGRGGGNVQGRREALGEEGRGAEEVRGREEEGKRREGSLH